MTKGALQYEKEIKHFQYVTGILDKCLEKG